MRTTITTLGLGLGLGLGLVLVLVIVLALVSGLGLGLAFSVYEIYSHVWPPPHAPTINASHLHWCCAKNP